MASITKEEVVKAKISKVLYRSILKIQLADDLTFLEASEKIGGLSDEKTESYEKLVGKEVLRRMKREFMSAINSARNTIFENGYRAGTEKFKYNCSKCGEPIPVGDASWEDAKEYLSGKWHHKNCEDD